IFHRTRRGRQLDREAHVPAVDVQIFHEAEAHDVPIEIRIADHFQRVEHGSLFDSANLHTVKNNVHSSSMPEVSPNRSVMIVLAYLWLLALIPLLLEDKDAEVRWHAKHGLVLTVAELVLLFVYMTVTSIVSLAALALGVVLTLVLVFGWLGILA